VALAQTAVAHHQSLVRLMAPILSFPPAVALAAAALRFPTARATHPWADQIADPLLTRRSR
jgi:hypothetical protein